MTLEELYRDNYAIVFGYVLSLTSSRSAAEELAQETFARALAHPARYDGAAKPSTWLCAIAKNLVYDEARRRKRLLPLDNAERASLGGFEERIEDMDEARSIRAAAERLGEAQRSVFFMRTDGMSFRDIGAALGKNENWARVTFFRAKNAVLEAMEEQI